MAGLMAGNDASAASILARLSALEDTVGAHEADAVILLDAVSARERDYQRQEAILERRIESLEATFAEHAESHRSLTEPLERRIETLETQGQQFKTLLQQLMSDLASMGVVPAPPSPHLDLPTSHMARSARSQIRRRTP